MRRPRWLVVLLAAALLLGLGLGRGQRPAGANPPPSPGPGRAATPPVGEARLEATRYEAREPPTVLLRCRTLGLSEPVKFAWHLGNALHPVGWGVPLDESALLITLASESPSTAAGSVECTATGAGGEIARASHSFATVAIRAATLAADGLLTVEGSGFGAARGRDDALWLVPARGLAQPADHTCARASWADGRIVACLPKVPARAYQVRVQSGGRLGLGALVTVGK